jgi:pSer/pThr/pTyr-binding forkhead associated (FHA) protein
MDPKAKAGTSLTAFAKRFILDREREVKEFTYPVLLLEQTRSPAENRPVRTTVSSNANSGGEAWVYLLQRRVSADKSLVTFRLGRSETNDIVINDPSVSAFHAFLMYWPGSTKDWLLGDANSRNGTSLNGTKLGPNKSVPIPDRATVLLGHLELRFLYPKSFLLHIDKLLGK